MRAKFFLQTRQADGNYDCVPLPAMEEFPLDHLPRAGEMVHFQEEHSSRSFFVHAVHHHMTRGSYTCKIYVQKTIGHENGLVACVNCFARKTSDG